MITITWKAIISVKSTKSCHNKTLHKLKLDVDNRPISWYAFARFKTKDLFHSDTCHGQINFVVLLFVCRRKKTIFFFFLCPILIQDFPFIWNKLVLWRSSCQVKVILFLVLRKRLFFFISEHVSICFRSNELSLLKNSQYKIKFITEKLI